MGILDKIRGNDDEQIFEVGEVYYNEDAQQYFRVEQLEPHMKIRGEELSKEIHVDREVYQWKYKDGRITELDDDTIVINHD